MSKERLLYTCLSGKDYLSFEEGKAYEADSHGDGATKPAKYFADKYPHNWSVAKSKDRFSIGDKILCIDPVGYLVSGEVYTVKKLHNNGQDVSVNECSNPTGFGCYDGKRFCNAEVNVTLSWQDMNVLDAIFDIADTFETSLVLTDTIRLKLNKAIEDATS